MNLVHIESRPSKNMVGVYDFFVSCDDSKGGLKEAIADLKSMSKHLTVLSRNKEEQDKESGNNVTI